MSLPIRYARLIELTTNDDQSLRCDCSQLLGEIQRLLTAERNPEDVSSAELVAEEIAYSTCIALNQPQIYSWNADNITSTISWTSGVRIMCGGDEKARVVNLTFVWNDPGTTDYKNVRKYLSTRCESAVSQLSKSGWLAKSAIDLSADRASFSMTISTRMAISSMKSIISTLSKVVPSFRF